LNKTKFKVFGFGNNKAKKAGMTAVDKYN